MAEVLGEGSVVQLERDKPKGKCRKWQLRVPIGRDVRTGKYRQKTRVVKGVTYTQAAAELRKFIEEVKGDHVQGRTDWTFEAYCEHYLDMREARKELAPGTLQRFRSQFKSVCFHIGKAKLEKITPSMLDEMYIAMTRGDSPSGKKVSGRYVSQLHVVVSQVLSSAVKEGIIVANPCDEATPPKPEVRQRKAIPPEKARAFIEELDPTDTHELAYLLAITLGLRRGEICGLSWGDVDWERRTVEIRHSYDSFHNLKETKTRAGMRMLPLSDFDYEALRRGREGQLDRLDMANGYRSSEEGFLTQGEGTPVILTHYYKRATPQALSYWWGADRDKFGLGEYSLHELRHTYLSLLALEGVHPKVMQELAGHASSKVTMDIYTHVNMQQKRDAAEAVSKMF